MQATLQVCLLNDSVGHIVPYNMAFGLDSGCARGEPPGTAAFKKPGQEYAIKKDAGAL
jgi:hypothetical protein